MASDMILPPPDPTIPVASVDYDYTNCRLCPLWMTSTAELGGQRYRRSRVYGRGTGANGLYLMGEALGANEVVYGSPFVGAAGRLLSEYLKVVNIDEQQCWVSNPVRCRPVHNKTPTATEMRTCQSHHLEFDLPHPQWRPKLLLLLGQAPLKYFLNKTKLGDKRGIFYDATFLGAPVKALATFHPAKVLRTAESGQAFLTDLRKARQYILGQPVEVLPPIRRSHIQTEENYLQWMHFFLGLPVGYEVTCDIETTGLDFRRDSIVSVSLVTRVDGKYFGCAFLTFPKEGFWWFDLSIRNSLAYRCLKTVLERLHVTYHNGDFDTKFFWEIGIQAQNFFDTLDAHLMIHENPPHGLKSLVVDYLGDSTGYQHIFQDALGDKTQYHSAPPEILLRYNLDDSFYTQILKERFTSEMIEDDMYEFFFRQAMPLKRAVTRMSYRGIMVDAGKICALAKKNRELILEKRAELYQLAGQVFNEASPAQLTTVLYHDLGLPVLRVTKESKQPSTDKAALEELGKKHRVPLLVLELRHLKKMNSTYLDGNDGVTKQKSGGLLDHIDRFGRVHASLLTHGTNSGRLSSSNPNLLATPKEKEFRQCFLAPPGWKLIDADFKQAELVLLAYLSGDANFIHAVNTSDMHNSVYRQLMGLAEEAEIDDDMRKIAKKINFRKCYRGGSKGLAEELKITEEQATQWYMRWDRRFPRVSEWFNDMDIQWMTQSVITSIYGRKRRFPVEELSYLYTADPRKFNETKAFFDRVGVNFPCQSAVGEKTNETLILLTEWLERRFGAWTPETVYLHPGPVLTVHDELIVEAPDHLVPEMVAAIRAIMTLPLPQLNIALNVDIEVKQSWGDGNLIVLEAEQEEAREYA